MRLQNLNQTILWALGSERWHGVDERELVYEYANSIRFSHNFIGHAEEV